MKGRTRKFGLFFAIVLSLASVSIAHPGRTDGYGEHYVRKSGWGHPVGSYHYHSGPYAGYSVSYKGEVPVAFNKKAAVSSSNASTLKVQERLNEPGYKIGLKTKQALKTFKGIMDLKWMVS